MDREAWQASVHGVERVGHDLATKSSQNLKTILKIFHHHENKLDSS